MIVCFYPQMVPKVQVLSVTTSLLQERCLPYQDPNQTLELVAVDSSTDGEKAAEQIKQVLDGDANKREGFREVLIFSNRKYQLSKTLFELKQRAKDGDLGELQQDRTHLAHFCGLRIFYNHRTFEGVGFEGMIDKYLSGRVKVAGLMTA